MRKKYAAIITVILMICAGNAFAQRKLVTDAQKKQLVNLAATNTNSFAASHQKALSLAKARGWIVSQTRKNGGVIYLQKINSLGFPVYTKTNDNILSAATTQTNKVQPGGSTGLNLSGSSTLLKNKLAIWDGGLVYRNHQEFAGKTITYKSVAQVIDHATHVAGTMIAKGVYTPAKGMAFNASTLSSYFFLDDVSSMSSAASGLLLSNHSYGDASGWDLDDVGNWYWYGLPGDTTDYSFGIYNEHAQAYDQIAYNAPYYLIVESAGNARGYTGPPTGGIFYGYKSRTNDSLVLKIRGVPGTQGISNQQGYDGISTAGNAKNTLTVGAVGPLPFGPANRQDVKIASFSSYGPTDDGRVKPDIVGMGVDVLSTGSSGPQNYIIESGTSMSSPNITGSLYLLQEYYAQKNAGGFMHAATLKGLACATAFDAGNPGPDYIYGWGLLDMAKATQAITDNGTKSIVQESTLSQGQVQTNTVTASGGGPLIATISWTDPAGTPTAEGVINDRTIKLVNDLDIRVSDGTTTFKPWILDPAHPATPATTGDNIRDNVEQVYLANAVPGRTYTITVSHKGILQSGSQAYSLIVTGIGGTSYCSSAPLSNADSRINNVTLSNINNTPAAGCTSYTDYTNLTATLERAKIYPISLNLGTCGSNFNKIAKVYIDWNGNGSFTDAGELVAISGVVNGTGTYNTNITVPLSVTPGNYSLMRVVLTETSDTTAVKPCGTYAKGETQDYRVQFAQTGTDVGITAITAPGNNGNCAGTTPITVTVNNFGGTAITNIPVQVTVKGPDNQSTIFNETYTGMLSPSTQDNFNLAETFNAAPGATYTITAATKLNNDAVTSNDQSLSTIAISTDPQMSSLSANYCNGTGHYLLSGMGDGEIYWYADNTSTKPLAFGRLSNTSQAPVNNTYYAGLNDFTAHVGPATKYVFGFGGYNQFGPAVNVHTEAPVIIKSARLYVGNSGKITFSVSNSNGETLSSTTINAVATSSHPQSGAQADDPTDQGKVYELNLALPAAGDYMINTTFADAATLYRNNGGVEGYPFTASNIFSITGSTVSIPPDSSYKNYYYYFYDMQVKAMGCATSARQAVGVQKPVIIQKTAPTLSSNFTTGNQWLLNDAVIPGATGQIYTPVKSGKYKVAVTFASGCSDTSANYAYVITPSVVDNDISLSAYPVPASTVLNVSFSAKTSNTLIIQVIDHDGKIVRTINKNIPAGNFTTAINVQNQATGNYILKLTLGQKVYTSKIIINK